MKKRILKGTILTVGAVAIISMVMLISNQFKPQPQIEFKEPTEETTEKEIIPEIPKEEVIIPEVADEKVEDSIIEQELQPQIEIPEPTEDIPEEKPIEVPKEKPTEKEEIEVPPITDIELNDLERIPPAPKPPKEPPKDGEVYFPGFGYVVSSGENVEIIGDSDGDINKQVGEM